MKRAALKADLHVHSKFSMRPSEWILQKIGCSESYTEPLELYSTARKRGMDLVTITDHNTLHGSLEIAHLENTFVSEEITTYFPADRCKIHILAWDITERQHEDISRVREDIFELASYLYHKRITHAVAHPMYALNDKLTPDHFELLLLLFKNFELNGSRDDIQSGVLTRLLADLTPKDIHFLAEKHKFNPIIPEPWKKNLTAGSDDHSSLNIARLYTEVKGADSVRSFLEGLNQGRGEVLGKAATPATMPYNLYSIAFQFYKHKFNLDQYMEKDLLFRFVDRALTRTIGTGRGPVRRLYELLAHLRAASFNKKHSPKSLHGLIYKEALEIVTQDENLPRLFEKNEDKPWEAEKGWFRFVDRSSEKVLKGLADTVLASVSKADIFDIFSAIGSAGSSYILLAPYFVGYSLFTKDRRFCRLCLERFDRMKNRKKPRERLKVAHFTDTFFEVNGVAKTLQQQVDMARKKKKMLTMITCGAGRDVPGVKNFEPIGAFGLPEYPDLTLFYPPLLKMLNYCHEENFTHIHSATPGPIGVAALAIAKILKLPFLSTYHTAFPQYVSILTDDFVMEELMWKYMAWYYNQADVVYVPSQAFGAELAEKGIKRDKIRSYPRGADVDLFHPSKHNGFFKNRFDLPADEIKLLYVGRVSKEKNLPALARMFTSLSKIRKNIRLIVVGDGPYLAEMKEALAGSKATFTGFLEGDDLAQAYASSDIFIFPSTTDTFGNVVLEAQASGLPVIVTDKGGPRENLIPGETGLIVSGEDAQNYIQAVLKLADDPDLLQTMKENAHAYMKDRSFETGFLELWDMYRTASA